MIRIVLALIAGIVAAVLTVAVTEFVGHTVYPPSASADLHTAEGVAVFMDSIPLGAKIFVIAGWFLGSLVGGLLANRIAGKGWPALIVAAFIIAGGVYTLFLIPHPLWMQIAAVLLPAVAAAIAVSLSRRAA